jgi:hypothetical protein
MPSAMGDLNRSLTRLADLLAAAFQVQHFCPLAEKMPPLVAPAKWPAAVSFSGTVLAARRCIA